MSQIIVQVVYPSAYRKEAGTDITASVLRWYSRYHGKKKEVSHYERGSHFERFEFESQDKANSFVEKTRKELDNCQIDCKGEPYKIVFLDDSGKEVDDSIEGIMGSNVSG